MKPGDVVTLKSGKPFRMASDLHDLNPVFFLKIRRIDGNKVWLEYKLGWLEMSTLEEVKK